MDELITFLRERLDEDERVASTAGDGGDCGTWTTTGETVDFDQYEISGFHPSTGAHVARHDPARTLREVEAKKRILDELEGFIAEAEDLPQDERNADKAEGFGILRLMALPYSDHPAYQEEWRP
ncbi:DUF6221 family protein [Nonomuraea lactucae]|uniref:DUF6221 family protein n=1 Tax=Nonomuraea lactucae TaxID=2249762 RepID=UPI000DE32E20|nr:DUF6221 family protein [Nonomuraea lactucae]